MCVCGGGGCHFCEGSTQIEKPVIKTCVCGGGGCHFCT